MIASFNAYSSILAHFQEKSNTVCVNGHRDEMDGFWAEMSKAQEAAWNLSRSVVQ